MPLVSLPGLCVLNEVTLVHLKAGYGFGKQMMGGSRSFVGSLVRTRPWLSLLCVDRTGRTASSALQWTEHN